MASCTPVAPNEWPVRDLVAEIGGHLFNKAKGGDTAAQIFWLKTRAQWRETSRVEQTGADGGPIKTEEVGQGAAKLSAFVDAISSRTDSGASG